MGYVDRGSHCLCWPSADSGDAVCLQRAKRSSGGDVIVIVDGAQGRIYQLQEAVGYRHVCSTVCMATNRDAGAGFVCFPTLHDSLIAFHELDDEVDGRAIESMNEEHFIKS